jgi:chemotaxis protein MotB
MVSNNERPIVIKRIKKAAHGHHGGAWKVAYADFVTAMMAFFLLLWLVNTTSPEQKRGIADYFAPASISRSTSGSGGILGGVSQAEKGARGDGTPNPDVAKAETPPAQQEAQSTSTEDPTEDKMTDDQVGASPETDQSANSSNTELEEARFTQAEMSLRQAMQDMPELAELSKNLIIDQTPEGLRIQIVDQEGRPMFAPGETEPNDRAKLLLGAVAKVINQLPNRLAISGHTDANPYYKADGTTDWELSAARANTSRRVLEMSGVDRDRVYSVSGKAASEPLMPEDPYQPANRRISVVLLREAPVLPPGQKP